MYVYFIQCKRRKCYMLENRGFQPRYCGRDRRNYMSDLFPDYSNALLSHSLSVRIKFSLLIVPGTASRTYMC